MEDCLNSFLLSNLVCIPYLAKLSFGHFSSITKMGGGGGGGLYIYIYIYIYIYPATNRSLDVANLIIFISKNRGNKSLKIKKIRVVFFFSFSGNIFCQVGKFRHKIIIIIIKSLLAILVDCFGFSSLLASLLFSLSFKNFLGVGFRVLGLLQG